MKLGYYPGCSLKGGSREYKESVVAMAKALDIELIEIPDWNCCGATAAHNLNRELSLSLPARILSIAEKEGMQDIVVPCAACYSRLTVTQYELKEDKSLKDKVISVVGMEYQGTTQVLNIIQFIQKYIADKIEEKTVKPFRYKVACYYGCLLVRPHNILKFDRVEDPQLMDDLVRKAGRARLTGHSKPNAAGRACQFPGQILSPGCRLVSWKTLLTATQKPLWLHARCAIQTWICAGRRSMST